MTNQCFFLLQKTCSMGYFLCLHRNKQGTEQLDQALRKAAQKEHIEIVTPV